MLQDMGRSVLALPVGCCATAKLRIGEGEPLFPNPSGKCRQV